jgi:hypothetical protein
VTTVALGLLTGLLAGAVMARGNVCFNAGLRHAVFERRPTVLRVFAIAVAIELLLLPLLLALGVNPLERSSESGGPALLPAAQLAGGLVFGAGMALAGGCITGILWKAGAGSIATALAVGGFAAGELLARGPGVTLIGDLDDVARPSDGSLHELSRLPYEAVAIALGVTALALLVRRRDGLALGVALGVVASLAWVAADFAGYGYGLGFVGGAEGTRQAIASGSAVPFQLSLALGVLAGGAAVVRGPLRTPDPARAGRAVAGGVLMGLGGNAAHGCNIGHGLTGMALLSIGSLLAVVSMAAGALVTWHFLLRPRPALRGIERPEPAAW